MKTSYDFNMKKSLLHALSPWLREKIILSTILALACVFWLSKCDSSLTLDETMTYWVVQDGFTDAIYRSIHYQGPGPLHYMIVWLFVQFAGNSEIVLRLPSILASILLCIVLYQFSCKIFDKESAFLGVVILLCLNGILAYAVFARAYALALLLSVSSTYALYRWTESNERRYKFFYIFFSTLTVYTHCVFTGIFIVHLIYLCYRRKWVKDHAFPTIREMIEVYLCIAVLLFPASYQVALIAGKKNIMGFASAPTVFDLIQSWIKPYLLIFLISSVLAARIVSKNIHIERFTIQPDLYILLLSWYLLPALVVFLYSLVSGASIFAPRYYLWSLPALSLLLGKGLSLIKPTHSRHILLTIFVGLMLIYGGLKSPFNEDWSSAVAFTQTSIRGSNIPVIVYTGIVEAQDTDWLIHPEKKNYLLSPFAAYKLDRKPFLLPASFEQEGAAKYLEETVFPELNEGRQFYLILRMTYLVLNHSPVFSDFYLTKKMGLAGFLPKNSKSFGHVKVITFEKV